MVSTPVLDRRTRRRPIVDGTKRDCLHTSRNPDVVVFVVGAAEVLVESRGLSVGSREAVGGFSGVCSWWFGWWLVVGGEQSWVTKCLLQRLLPQLSSTARSMKSFWMTLECLLLLTPLLSSIRVKYISSRCA